MAQLLIRRLDDDVKARLKARAKKQGRSLEAEARAILEDAAKDQPLADRTRKKEQDFGTLMHEQFKHTGLTDEEYALFQQGIDELNGNWGARTRKSDKERARAAPTAGFGTRASARFKGIGLTRRELETFNRAVDKRRRERPRFVKFDR